MTKECSRLHEIVRTMPRFRAGFDPSDIPHNGIYFLFENGETAHAGERVVRVGTHTGSGNLPKRIFEHLYTPNKDRSIFRKHVGRCLLHKQNDPFIKFWEIDLTKKADRERYASQIDMTYQAKIERAVTDYMAKAFSFSVVRIDEKPSRMAFEEKFISTVCSCNECHASLNWLGKSHPNELISRSGLWNIQGQKGLRLTSADLDEIEKQMRK